MTVVAMMAACGQSESSQRYNAASRQSQSAYPDLTNYGAANARASSSGTLAGTNYGTSSSSSSGSKSGSSKGLWAAVGIVGVVGAGLLAWYLMKKKDGGSLSSLFGKKSNKDTASKGSKEAKPSDSASASGKTSELTVEKHGQLPSSNSSTDPVPAAPPSDVPYSAKSPMVKPPAHALPSVVSDNSLALSRSTAEKDCEPESPKSGFDRKQLEEVLKMARAQVKWK